MAKTKKKQHKPGGLPNRGTLLWVIGAAIVLGLAAFIGVFLLLYTLSVQPGNGVTLYGLAQTTATIVGALTVGAIAVIQLRKHMITEAQAHDTRNTQYSERLSKAIEHLGDVNEYIRLGAVYELKRLAEDSVGDRENIVEILDWYFRTELIKLVRNDTRTIEEKKKRKNCPRPPSDVLEAQKVVHFIYKELFKQGADWRYLVATNIDLSGVDFRGSDFRHVNLSGANLYGSAFNGSDLRGANFSGAGLSGVHFSGANLGSANLSEANLSEAIFSEVRFRRTLFRRTLFRRTLFRGVPFRDVILNEADLFEADLRGADLTRAGNLTRRQLYGVIMDEDTKPPSHLIDDPE